MSSQVQTYWTVCRHPGTMQYHLNWLRRFLTMASRNAVRGPRSLHASVLMCRPLDRHTWTISAHLSVDIWKSNCSMWAVIVCVNETAVDKSSLANWNSQLSLASARSQSSRTASTKIVLCLHGVNSSSPPVNCCWITVQVSDTCRQYLLIPNIRLFVCHQCKHLEFLNGLPYNRSQLTVQCSRQWLKNISYCCGQLISCISRTSSKGTGSHGCQNSLLPVGIQQ